MAISTIKEEHQSASLPAVLWPVQYDLLNGWRGLAAITVVVNHVSGLPIGHLAVMVFFVISGYCITASAESSLRRGFGFRQFMARRVRRIYPPYFFSLVFFVLTRLVKTGQGGANQLNQPLTVWLQNLTLTQWVTLLFQPRSYAADNPALFVAAYWSLNYEEQFYLVVGLLMVYATISKRDIYLPIIGLIVCGLLWNLAFTQRSYGFFIEYWVHFGIGSLVFYRLCRWESSLWRRGTDAILLLAVIICGCFAWHGGVYPAHRSSSQEILIASLFALSLIYLRPLDEYFKKSWLGWIFIPLGTITYSLYLIHQFNLRIVGAITSHIIPGDWPLYISIAVQVLLHTLIAIPFWFLCERPFLNKLSASQTVTSLPSSG